MNKQLEDDLRHIEEILKGYDWISTGSYANSNKVEAMERWDRIKDFVERFSED